MADRQKVTRVVTMSALFPELKGGACNQQGRGTGGSIKSAGAAAWRNLMSQPKLKRKHFTTLTAIVSIGTVAVGNADVPSTYAEEPEENQ